MIFEKRLVVVRRIAFFFRTFSLCRVVALMWHAIEREWDPNAPSATACMGGIAASLLQQNTNGGACWSEGEACDAQVAA